MTTNPRMPTHSSNYFSHVGGKVWACEISDLPRPVMARVYDDACDLGFRMRSERTGRVEAFRICSEDRDDEGDVIAWTLEPVDEYLRKRGIRLRVFND